MTRVAWHIKLSFLAGAAVIAAALTLMTAASQAQAALGGHHHHAAKAPKAHKQATARNGDNGTVKVHRSGTPVTDRANQPHVCVFYLDAFGFDPAQAVSWNIQSWPPTGDRSVVSSGTLTLDDSGNGFTADMTLADGHYKLNWNFAGEKGSAKHKVFWVKCSSSGHGHHGHHGHGPKPTPAPVPPSASPSPTQSSVPPTPAPVPSGSNAPSPASTSSASPSPSVAATSASSTPPGGGLPTTGQPLALIAGTGLGLLATGGGALMLARRRRGYGR